MGSRVYKGKIFLFVNIAFISGIAAATVFPQCLYLFGFISIAAVGIAFCSLCGARLFAGIACSVLFGVGIFLGSRAAEQYPTGFICGMHGSEMYAQGTIHSCVLRKGVTQCELRNIQAGRINEAYPIEDMRLKEYQGNLLLFFNSPAGYQYGNLVAFRGALSPIRKSEDFDYEAFLRSKGIYGIVYDPAAMLVARPGSVSIHRSIQGAVWQVVFRARAAVRQSLQEIWHGDVCALMAGLLIGDTESFSEPQKNYFRLTGIYHIVAVSGSHIVLIAELVLPVLFAAGAGRTAAYLLTAGIIALFVLMIGMPPSAVRAFLMGCLVFLGKICGRTRGTNNILFFTASAMLAHNPLLLAHDAGFQLSFSAVFGLVHLSSGIERRLGCIPEWFGTRKIMSATLAAQIATAPVSIMQFRFFSLIAPIANFAVAAVIAPLTIAGGAVLAVSLISSQAARIAALPVTIGASYVLAVSRYMGNLSWAGIKIPSFY